MKIALVAPLYESVPPRLYGGTERVVAHLADALADAGHDVTLFASGDSHTRAHLAPARARALWLDPAPQTSAIAAHLSLLHEVRRRRDEFEVLHFHLPMLHFPFFEDCAARTLTTLHSRLDRDDFPDLYRRWPRYPLASLSDRQRKPLAHARWLGTVPNGLPLDLYPFSPTPRGGYLAFLGRISPDKRLDRAITIARRAGLPLKIAAKIDPAHRDYFHDTIRPLLDAPGVEYLGEIGDGDKGRFLGDALALLFPIDWPEPFGLVMIEAMACGTPVIGWDCGSVPEVVDEGISGCVVDSEAAAVAAVATVDRLDRRAVRAAFERRFCAAAMTRGYLELYRRLGEPAGYE